MISLRIPLEGVRVPQFEIHCHMRLSDFSLFSECEKRHNLARITSLLLVMSA